MKWAALAGLGLAVWFVVYVKKQVQTRHPQRGTKGQAEMSAWPPRSEDGLHGATYEWDGPNTAVRCICGFYRITDTHERAEMEYMHHIPAAPDYRQGEQQ